MLRRSTCWSFPLSLTAESSKPSAGGANEQSPLENELAVLLVEALNLEVAAADIAPEAPLYGEGLGLDSIDILEVALEVSRRVSGSAASFTWIPDDFLEKQQLGEWIELPLWIPEREGPGVGDVNCARAISAGLTFRPLAETVRATLDWLATRPADYVWKAGLAPEREAEVLAAWHTARQEAM